ncbi:hypothetical protein TARUN_4732 [Trichoderma arundinaceum]|uniref:Uncharacterized protein n=1 Tax=Trichoderma arundinaceum TaxID=490622 RepID=A0A395NNE6_TRIAR|nr:hypothetical protein TARUN_4732 [Trichoderma arundinaceum]
MLPPASLLSVIAGLALLSAPASARTWAGGVNMIAACQEQHGGVWQAILNCDKCNAYDWMCYDPDTGEWASVDVNAYCAQTYGGGAYADPQGGGPYDWGCYFP